MPKTKKTATPEAKQPESPIGENKMSPTKTKNTTADQTASTQENPAVEPQPFLPRTVERIASAVAAILRYSEQPLDLERLILATVSEETREKSYRSVYAKTMGEEVRKRQITDLPGMLKDLADFRSERPDFRSERPFEADQPVLDAIVGQIRRSSLEQCAREFDDFLRNADPEEIRFLYNVLNWWSSKGGHRNELSIATAFFDEIDSNIEIFRVPQEHSAAVEQYIEALRKADLIAEAAA